MSSKQGCLQSESHDSQDYAEKPYLKKQNVQTKKKNKNKQKGVFPNTIIKLCSLIFFYVLSSCPINYSILN